MWQRGLRPALSRPRLSAAIVGVRDAELALPLAFVGWSLLPILVSLRTMPISMERDLRRKDSASPHLSTD